MARDRSKPWGKKPDQDREHTEPDVWDDEATQNAGRRRAPRKGARRNDDETNVGGSLLPGDDFGLAAVFEQALAPAYVSEPVDEIERTEPVASSPKPPPAGLSGAKPSARRVPPPRPREPVLELPEPTSPPPKPAPPSEDESLGPVEEFTISGLMPDELKAMTEAARQAIDRADIEPPPAPSPPKATGTRPAQRIVHADPPRTSRHDPDPLITGVLAPAGGPPPGERPGFDDEETLAMNLNEHPDLLEKLRAPVKGDGGRDYHTFGAGLQRLDEFPNVPPRGKPPEGGGILELLDGSPPPASPTGPNPAPAPAPPVDPGRPRRVSTNRAGSMGRGSRAPTPARQRSVVPNPKGATPRPAPARADRPAGSPPQREALRHSGGRGRAAQGKQKPLSPRPTSPGRAHDEESRIRAALAAVSDDEHTSWVRIDEPELQSPTGPDRAAGNRPRAQRPDGTDLPGVTPVGMVRKPTPESDKAREPSLTMSLSEVKPSDEPTRLVPASDIGDEATIPNARSSLGDEVTIPAGPPPLSDDATVPVQVPNTRARAESSPPPSTGARPQAVTPPAAKPPPAKPPSAKPPPKSPQGRGGAGRAEGKPPVDISPLGDDKPESYRDGALPWIASMFAVMVIGSGVILLLIMLLYLI